jgi:hypothetical protein
MKQPRKIALASALMTGLCAASSLAAGPGFGNLSYTDAEVFKHVSLFDNSNGTPTDSPSKAYGHNVALYLDGYLVFTFAPDSGNPTGGWLAYDVSNPRSPKLAHAHRGQDTAQLREPHSLPLALIGDKTYVGVQTSVGIQIWDMTDPLSPSIAGRLSLPGVNAGDYTDVSWQLSWQFPYLYVAGGNRGVYIVDTTDVAQPKLVTQVQTSRLGGFRVGPIFAHGDRLYLGNMDENARYSLLDLSDPTDPQLLDTLGTQTRYYAMAVLGNLIVGAGRDGDLLVHEDRDGSIELVKQHRIEGDGLYLSFQDGFIHYGQTGSYKKLSFSDPNNVSILGNTHLPGHDADHGQVTPFGNLVFIGNDHGSGSALVVHQKAADSTPPGIDWSFPSASAVNVSNATTVGVTFSDNVDPATLQGGNVRLEAVGGGAVDGVITYLFNTLHFRSKAPLAEDTTYRFTISTGVKDIMGNALAADHQITFSTGSTIMSGSGGSGGQGSAGQASSGGAGGTVGLGGSGGGGAGGLGTAGSTAGATAGGAPSGGNGTGGSVPAAGMGNQGGVANLGGSATSGAGRGGAGASNTAGMSAAGVSNGGSLSAGGAPGEPTPVSDESGCSFRAAGSTQGNTQAGWLIVAATAACVGLRRRRG